MRRRTLYAVLCVVSAVLAVAVGAVGSVLALTFGADDAIVSEPTAVDAPGAAVIAEQLRVDTSSLPTPTGIGTLTIDVDPVGPQSIFVGQAAESDLDGYFRGAPYDVVVALEPGGKATLRSVPGTATPAAPQEQSFWTRSATGAAGQTVSFDTSLDDRTSLVIMNAEPSDGVQVDLRVTFTVPGIWRTALILLGAAILLAVLAILLCWRSRAAGRRARARAAAPVGAGTGASDVLPGPSSDTAPIPTVRPIVPPSGPRDGDGGAGPT